MSFIQTLERLKRIDALIRRKATGTPAQLAERLDVSEASLYRYLNDLRDLGAPIKYCSQRLCYIYNAPFELTF